MKRLPWFLFPAVVLTAVPLRAQVIVPTLTSSLPSVLPPAPAAAPVSPFAITVAAVHPGGAELRASWSGSLVSVLPGAPAGRAEFSVPSALDCLEIGRSPSPGRDAAVIRIPLPMTPMALHAALSGLFDGAPARDEEGSAPQSASGGPRLEGRKQGGGSFEPTPPSPSPYSDSEIVEMALSFAKSMKGQPWSFTEYNASLYYRMEDLRQKGVPERQIKLFEKTCEDFPGRPFNPWSGD